MPRKEIDVYMLEPSALTHQALVGTVERAVLLRGTGLKLRRLNTAESAFDAEGTYLETTVVLPNVVATAATELISFDTAEMTDYPYGGSLTYQLSPDNGSTWWIWDTTGGAWVQAINTFNGVFNGRDVLNENFPTFPLSNVPTSKQLRVKVKLTPSGDGSLTPLLYKVVLAWELKYDYLEDLSRSVKRYLEQTLRVPKTYQEILPSTGVYTSLEIKEAWASLDTVITVYDLTNDPGRLTNQYVSKSNMTVYFNQIYGGNTIEINYSAGPSVFLSADENYQMSTLPSVVVEIPQVAEMRQLRGVEDVDYQRVLGKARVRAAPVFFATTLRIRSQSSLKHEALKLADAVTRAVAYRRKPMASFLSLATGDLFWVYEFTPITPADVVGRKLFVMDVTFKVVGKAWIPDGYEEQYLVQTIRTSVHPSVPADESSSNYFTEEILDDPS